MKHFFFLLNVKIRFFFCHKCKFLFYKTNLTPLLHNTNLPFCIQSTLIIKMLTELYCLPSLHQTLVNGWSPLYINLSNINGTCLVDETNVFQTKTFFLYVVCLELFCETRTETNFVPYLFALFKQLSVPCPTSVYCKNDALGENFTKLMA